MHVLVALGCIVTFFGFVAVTVLLYVSRPRVRPTVEISGQGVAKVIPSAQIAKVLREQKPAPRVNEFDPHNDGIKWLIGLPPRSRDFVAEHARKVFGTVEKHTVPMRRVVNLAVKPFCPVCLEQHSDFKTYPACPAVSLQ